MRIKENVRIVPAFAIIPTKIDNKIIWWKRYFLIQEQKNGRSYDGDPIKYWSTKFKATQLFESSIYNLYNIDTKEFDSAIKFISKIYKDTNGYQTLVNYYKKEKSNKKEKYNIRRLYKCFYLILKYLR